MANMEHRYSRGAVYIRILYLCKGSSLKKHKIFVVSYAKLMFSFFT